MTQSRAVQCSVHVGETHREITGNPAYAMAPALS